ncbi:MAG: hypothetical protein AB7F96_16530 [Beijerinckiaceae bacterium]
MTDIFPTPPKGVAPTASDYQSLTAALQTVHKLYPVAVGACRPTLDPIAFNDLLNEFAALYDLTIGTDEWEAVLYSPTSHLNLLHAVQYVQTYHNPINQMTII